MNRELLLIARDKYYLLNLINPRHELLKYFTLEIGENEDPFRPTSDEKIGYEFIERFRGNVMSLDDYVKVKAEVPYEDYLKELFYSMFSNYNALLEKEINRLEAGN
jgi:hypothetical protein